MSKAIKIVFVEDHEQFRSKLVELASAAPNLELVGTYADGSSALKGIPQVKPDVVVMDILPFCHGGLVIPR